MGKSNYSNGVFKDLELAYKKIDELEKVVKELRLELSIVKEENRKLRLELDRKDIINNKDCICSSIPSSQCHFKYGISNSRKKSDKKPGAKLNHKGVCLTKDTVEKIKKDKSAKIIKKKINYSSQNKNAKPIIRYQLGYKIVPVVYEYVIYPNKDGKYDIPKELTSMVTYAPEVKTLAMNLFYNCNTSTDNIKLFFSDLFDYKISKGTLINWEKELEIKLRSQTGNILRKLLKEKYNHVDESQINVNGKTYNIHNVSSNKYTMQWVHKNKSHQAVESIGFLLEYSGILIKDGTHLYDKYCKEFVSCGAHINRYLIGANKGIPHKGEDNILMFFAGLKRRRKKLLKKGLEAVDEEEYKNIIIQYRFLLKLWKQEIEADKKTNPLYDEERRLQARLLADEKQHLKFMTDFSLPYTNNRAETDIRGVKQRMKVGVFRNEEAAERYVTIRSNISTYRKNNVNVYEALKSAFNNNTIIV